MEKNTELTIQNTDLQKQVVELHHVSDECAQLKNSLNQMETECVTAKSEVKSLSGKVCLFNFYTFKKKASTFLFSVLKLFFNAFSSFVWSSGHLKRGFPKKLSLRLTFHLLVSNPRLIIYLP